MIELLNRLRAERGLPPCRTEVRTWRLVTEFTVHKAKITVEALDGIFRWTFVRYAGRTALRKGVYFTTPLIDDGQVYATELEARAAR